MKPVPDKFDLESWLPVIRLVAWGLAAIVAAFGGAGALTETTGAELRAVESQGAATAAELETFRAWESHREDIEAAMIARAKCDSALESFARHREDDRDWAHVIEECHTEGEIRP